MLAEAEQRPAAHHRVALVRVVEAGQLDFLAADVVPDVQFRPVTEREDAEVFARGHFAAVEVPQLGALVLRVPLAELVAVGEKTFLGAGLFLVAPGSAEGRVKAPFRDRIQQRHALQAVAAGTRAGFLAHAARADTFLDARHDELRADLRHEGVAVVERLAEVVPGIDVHQREGQLLRPEGLAGQVREDD